MNIRKCITTLAAITTIAGLVTLGPTAPAQATAQHQTIAAAGGTAPALVTPPTEWIPLPAGCSTTPYTAYGKTGWFACGTDILWVNWTTNSEYFGIGTDGAVWHIAPWFSNWRSMGGQAGDMAQAFYDASGHATVQVYVPWATDVYWCSTYTSAWSGWYAC